MSFLPINVAGVAPAQDFAYPAGEYILRVKEVKVEPTKNGQGFRLLVKSEILMGPGPSLDLQNKPFTHSFALTENSRMFLVQFAEACGLRAQIDQSGGQIAEEWFPGCQYLAFISQKDGYFNATKLRSIDAWTHSGGAQQPGNPQAGVAQPGLLQPMPARPQMQSQQQMPAPQAQIPTPQAPPQQGYAPAGNGQQQGQYQQQQQGQYQQQPQQPQQQQQFQPQGGYAAPPVPQQPQQPQVGYAAPPPPGQIPGQG